jgi:hypothetical protein
LRDLNSVVIFSIGFSFPFKNNKIGAPFYSTKLEVGSTYYISLGVLCAPSEKIFTNTMMQGKKQSCAKKQRKIGEIGGRPAKLPGRPDR